MSAKCHIKEHSQILGFGGGYLWGHYSPDYLIQPITKFRSDFRSKLLTLSCSVYIEAFLFPGWVSVPSTALYIQLPLTYCSSNKCNSLPWGIRAFLIQVRLKTQMWLLGQPIFLVYLPKADTTDESGSICLLP